MQKAQQAKNKIILMCKSIILLYNCPIIRAQAEQMSVLNA